MLPFSFPTKHSTPQLLLKSILTYGVPFFSFCSQVAFCIFALKYRMPLSTNLLNCMQKHPLYASTNNGFNPLSTMLRCQQTRHPLLLL